MLAKISEENKITFPALSSAIKEAFLKHRIPYYSPPADIFEKFENMKPGDRSRVLTTMSFYLDMIHAAIGHNWGIIDDVRMTWYALKRLGLRPPSSLFSKLDNLDCVEIYDTSGVQIYRNFNFCHVCTYSLEELLIFPWTDLYSRDGKIFGEMQEAARRALVSDSEPFRPTITPHIGTELRSARRRDFAVEFGLVSPLFSKDNKPTAFLAASRLKVVLDRAGPLTSHLDSLSSGLLSP